jgi:hypothetical protein
VPGAAVASDAGVQMTLRARAWHGHPANLRDAVIPVEITLENHGTHPIKVQHSLLLLRAPALDYKPLEPQALVQKTVIVRGDPLAVPQPGRDEWKRTGGASGSLATIGTGQSASTNYARDYASWTVDLPTRDMIDHALPEGVLAPGERISGFLYYEPLPNGIEHVRFAFDLVDAHSSLTLGHLAVPLVWRR